MSRGETVQNSGGTGSAPEVRAEVVAVRGPVGVIEADTVTIHQGGASEVRAMQVDMHFSGAGTIDGEVVHLDEAAAILIRGDSVMLVESTAGIVTAGEVHLDGSRAALVAGGTVYAHGTSTGVLLAREVHGDVSTVLDTRGALLAGIGGGLMIGLVLLVGGQFKGRCRR
ncbi:MAG: hypothetical protein MUO23_01750 [Anaerolineales bacterium]|nr:hypothetical protein [Anaerolineales bacterium]